MWDNFEEMVASHRYFVSGLNVIAGNELWWQIQIETTADLDYPPILGNRFRPSSPLFHSSLTLSLSICVV